MIDREAFPAPGHDHDRCVLEALASADAICRERGARLTPQRRRILEIVWTSHRPVGAYDILEVLNGDGGRAAPMTVYRALDFLIENGLVHRLASRNAFIGCDHPDARHEGHFLICRECGRAAELADETIDGAIRAEAERSGFTVQNQFVEIEGVCPNCRAGQ